MSSPTSPTNNFGPETTAEEKLNAFYKARGSFESNYIDDNVQREPPEPATDPAAKPTAKSSTTAEPSKKRSIRSSGPTSDSTQDPPAVSPSTRRSTRSYAAGAAAIAKSSKQLQSSEQTALCKPNSSMTTPTSSDLADDNLENVGISQSLASSKKVTPPEAAASKQAKAGTKSKTTPVKSVSKSNTTPVKSLSKKRKSADISNPADDGTDLPAAKKTTRTTRRKTATFAGPAVNPATATSTALSSASRTQVPTVNSSANGTDTTIATPAKAALPSTPTSTTGKRNRKPSSKAEANAHAAAAATAADTTTTPKSATQKKQPQPTISRDYVGIASQHGYPVNPPKEAELTVPWQCGEPSCASGMSWLQRHKDTKEGQAVGRKVISHFFGRNKTSTKLIPDDVWHWMCRKHYQRDKYAHDKVQRKETCLWIVNVIEDQLIRLKLWRPEATYNVRIMSAGEKRLNHWYAMLHKHNNDQTAALNAMPAPTAKNPTPEQNFPIVLLEHFSSNFAGNNKSYADLDRILTWLRQQVNANLTDVMCPMEFLLNKEFQDEAVYEPTYNYQEWEAKKDKKPFYIERVYEVGNLTAPGQNDTDAEASDNDAEESGSGDTDSNATQSTEHDTTEPSSAFNNNVATAATEDAEGDDAEQEAEQEAAQEAEQGEEEEQIRISIEYQHRGEPPAVPSSFLRRGPRVRRNGKPYQPMYGKPISSTYWARDGPGRPPFIKQEPKSPSPNATKRKAPSSEEEEGSDSDSISSISTPSKKPHISALHAGPRQLAEAIAASTAQFKQYQPPAAIATSTAHSKQYQPASLGSASPPQRRVFSDSEIDNRRGPRGKHNARR